jgi:outer membrane protein assembly factor BamB
MAIIHNQSARVLLCACVAGLLLSQALGAQSVVPWPCFRGPNAAGVADDQRPPVTFGPSEKVLWKRALPSGHSSPIVWNDRIFLTAVDGQALVVMALRRADGAPIWRREITPDRIETVHPSGSPAASTPATDGERVYAYFSSYGLVAYDFAGREVWRRPLPLLPIRFGTGTSPILVAGRVVLQRDGSSTDSELLALDAATGAVAWRTARPLMGESWSTPILWRQGDREEIVTIAATRVVGYSLDGVQRWSVSGLPGQSVAAAVVGDGMLFASSFAPGGSPENPIQIPAWSALIEEHDRDRDGNLTPEELPPDAGITMRPEVSKDTQGNFMTLRRILELSDADKNKVLTRAEWDVVVKFVGARVSTVLAIRPGGSGDSTGTHVAWKDNRGIPEIPSPLYYRGRLYFIRDGGMVTSYAPDGKLLIDRQRLGVLGQYAASPVAADGRIYAASVSGTIIVFRAGDALEVLARNDLGESVVATPAIAANNLYVRSAQHLWAFGDRP